MKGKRKRRRDRAAEATHSLFGDEKADAPEAEVEAAEAPVEVAPVQVAPKAAEVRVEVAQQAVVAAPVQVALEPELALDVAPVQVALEPELALDVFWEADAPADVVDAGVAVQPEPVVVETVAPSSDRLARARDLVARGKAQDAIAMYRDLLLDEPGNLKAYNNLGLLYEGLGQFERALEQFDVARAIEPDNVAVISNVGGALIGLGRFEDAERELRRALKFDPESVDVRTNLGILFFRRGQYAQAENELRWVCERDVDHAVAHVYRGEALNRLNKVDKAMEVLERAAALQPGNAKIYHTLGIVFDKKNMPTEAARMYRKVRELSK